jgi:RNA polymerase sigma-70 factor (ECF subfamily)
MSTESIEPPPPPLPRVGGDTSASLLQKARDNDPDAWRRLVHLYQPLILYWLGRAGVNDADAADLAQDVFMAAAGGLAGFRRDRPGDTFRGWLRGITRNHILLHHRRAGRNPAAAGGTDAFVRLQEVPSPAEDADDPPEELGNLYRRALELVRSEFEEKTWRAFWLTVVEGRAPVAVAPALGVSAAAIRQAKSRVLRRLREEVGDLNLDPPGSPAPPAG